MRARSPQPSPATAGRKRRQGLAKTDLLGDIGTCRANGAGRISRDAAGRRDRSNGAPTRPCPPRRGVATLTEFTSGVPAKPASGRRNKRRAIIICVCSAFAVVAFVCCCAVAVVVAAAVVTATAVLKALDGLGGAFFAKAMLPFVLMLLMAIAWLIQSLIEWIVPLSTGQFLPLFLRLLSVLGSS